MKLMKLHALEIPDGHAELVNWLEQHLVDLDLGQLVAELAAAHHEHTSAGSLPLSEVLPDVLPDVLDRGLAALDQQQLGRLLSQPRLLLELQEMILFHGGEYWDSVPPNASDSSLLDRGWRSLAARFAAKTSSHGVAQTSSRPRFDWYQQPWFVGLAAAAAVAFLMFSFRMPPTSEPSAVAWGWNREDVFVETASPASYLNGLADAADQWFRKRPTTANDLAQRLIQMRQGCSQLIFADHTPLAAEDRAWLVEKCRDWAAKLDQHLADVEAGNAVRGVRDAADETVRKLIIALRSRGEQLG